MSLENSRAEKRTENRTVRAATESMTIVALGRGEFKVYSGTRNAYVVDLIKESCECPDEEYNHPTDGCKHRQRVEMELGQREIPDLGRRTDVEIMTGRSRETEPTVATDGGVVADVDPRDSGPEIPHTADCSPQEARELTHELAMDVAAGGDLRDWGEHQAVVDVLWSSINAAVGSEIGR